MRPARRAGSRRRRSVRAAAGSASGSARTPRVARAVPRTRSRATRSVRRSARSPRSCSPRWRRRGSWLRRRPVRAASSAARCRCPARRPIFTFRTRNPPPEVLVRLGERLADRLDPDRDRSRHRVVRPSRACRRAARRGGARRGRGARCPPPRGPRERPPCARRPRGRARGIARASRPSEPVEAAAGERGLAGLEGLARDVLSGRAGAEADEARVRLDSHEHVADGCEGRLVPRWRTAASEETPRPGSSRG